MFYVLLDKFDTFVALYQTLDAAKLGAAARSTTPIRWEVDRYSTNRINGYFSQIGGARWFIEEAELNG